MRSKFLLVLLLCGQAGAQQLWPDGAPGSEQRHNEAEKVDSTYVSNIHDPSLTVVRANPRHANGAAVVIAPGGGHRMLVFENEGMVAAKSLNRVGVTAFVLKYRLARDAGSSYSIENDAAADLRRAVRWVRAHAADYGVDPQRVGVMGFSAGGELVSLVADNPEPSPPARQDAVDRQSAAGLPDPGVSGPTGLTGEGGQGGAAGLHRGRFRRQVLHAAGADAIPAIDHGRRVGRTALVC
ncbi:alpha/beta hydrolase [Duganella flavida]|uniref:alpha/beta hydrolase n=1 Tax=Duganella flavida TaxID=2692175 RepID=UPI003531275F